MCSKTCEERNEYVKTLERISTIEYCPCCGESWYFNLNLHLENTVGGKEIQCPKCELKGRFTIKWETRDD